MTKISNTADTQLHVPIKGAHGDLNSVTLQPKGTVDLPDGFTPVNPKQKSLFVHAEPAPVAPPDAPVASTKTTNGGAA